MSVPKTSRKPQPDEWSAAQVCAYYGTKRAWYFLIKKMGEDSGVPVPWGDPEALIEWFELMKSKGLRKHGPPDEVVAKASGLELSRIAPRPAPTAAPAPTPEPSPQAIAPPPPSAPPSDQPTDRHIEMDLLRQVAELTDEEKRQRESGMLKEAALTEKRLRLVREDLRKWKTSMPKMKDQAREMEQRRMMGRVAAALGRALLRGLTRELPEHKAAVTAAWNAVAEALPALLAEELGIQEKEQAA